MRGKAEIRRATEELRVRGFEGDEGRATAETGGQREEGGREWGGDESHQEGKREGREDRPRGKEGRKAVPVSWVEEHEVLPPLELREPGIRPPATGRRE